MESYEVGEQVVARVENGPGGGIIDVVAEVRGNITSKSGRKHYVVELPDTGRLVVSWPTDMRRLTRETRTPGELPAKVMGEETLNSANQRGADDIAKRVSDKFGGIIG